MNNWKRCGVKICHITCGHGESTIFMFIVQYYSEHSSIRCLLSDTISIDYNYQFEWKRLFKWKWKKIRNSCMHAWVRMKYVRGQGKAILNVYAPSLWTGSPISWNILGVWWELGWCCECECDLNEPGPRHLREDNCSGFYNKNVLNLISCRSSSGGVQRCNQTR